MKREYYIMEVEGEGCYCLCYDDVDGNRVVIDWDLEIREDWYMEKLIELAIKEQKEIYEEMREVHTEEDIRLSVYENLLDNLKYYMSDVAYG